MSPRKKAPFVVGEKYHVFNRGVEKRRIFQDKDDIARFLKSLRVFNTQRPVGSLYEHSFTEKHQLGSSTPKLNEDRLVDVLSYCLLPNHYHLLLEPIVEKGIERLMQKLGTGYTNYFNEKYDRSGSLFQGRYKYVHISSDKQLLYVSVYVNLNDKVHQLGSSTPKLVISSWGEFTRDVSDGLCNQSFLDVLGGKDYFIEEAQNLLPTLIEKKQKDEVFGKMIME